MKYEAVFGNQVWFEHQNNEYVVAFEITHDDESTEIQFDTEYPTKLKSNETIIAMRRIIAEPKRWTVEDQKAGRLPEVGAEVMCMDDSRHNFVGESIHAEHWALCHGKTKKVFHIPATAVRPVETDTERQQREREEWCSKALDSAGILSEMKCYELKRLGEYIGSIHDALLSGELKMPEVK